MTAGGIVIQSEGWGGVVTITAQLTRLRNGRGGGRRLRTKGDGGVGSYVLNRCSRILGTQPQGYEYHIPPSKPCIRQEHAHIQGECIHKTG